MSNYQVAVNSVVPWKRRWIFWIAIYVLLLGLSHTVRMAAPDTPRPADGQHSIALQSYGDQETGDSPVHIRYIDTQPGASENETIILLLHGSPMAAVTVFPELIQRLSTNARVIAPDLPGFGRSTRTIPDYSIQAHAEYMKRFLERIGVARYHAVAYSMGSGVALNLYELHPEKMQSLTMLSAIGVQEFELLGDYHLNHALHGAQLLFFRFITDWIPHFGILDQIPLNLAYAKNFYHSDQRPLRSILSGFSPATLIIHSNEDYFVPMEAANEHFRIVPQGELKIYPGGHLMILSEGESLAEDIHDFITRVGQGEAKTRAEADTDRAIASSVPFSSIRVPEVRGTTLAAIIVLIALATLISEDATCIGAGLLTARGFIGFLPAVFGCFAGIVIGDVLLFLAGRFFGKPALGRAPLKWFFKKEDVERAFHWFSAHGPGIILVSRFLPGSRLPTYFAAGMLGMKIRTFFLYFCMAGIVWTPLLVGLAMLLGDQLYAHYGYVQKYGIWTFAGIFIVLMIFIRILIPLFTHRGRRLLLSTWRRKVSYEFWPPYIFYLPVVGYILYLTLKHGNPTLFTAANPSIPNGSGFLGESKSRILDGLNDSSEYLPHYDIVKRQLPFHEKITRVESFLTNNGSHYPIVLKPDIGQRGKGVAIARSITDVNDFFATSEHDTIVQEYVDGHEYGVFYYRYPGSTKGKILSITDKKLLTVEGDGHLSLEQLILKHERALCMAPTHFTKHRHQLYRIIDAGEIVPLVELGTHSLGALFLDGSHVLTPKLEAKIDGISKSFKGFYFGRYDIRTPVVEDFKAGRNFKILELNGVTAEATHIYDPKNSIFAAYQMLFKQWRIAFDIGAINALNGAKPLSFFQFLKLIMHKDIP
ncbi:MAG: alpha/beta fold hydrolase [Desulfobacteraceae bacterium]|nr:alpha/beta fold hydrolase [Desulfobacteraceae bacterium]